ncbi:MAG: UTP--glucose-1-phosphate uridylyltransferase [Thermoplasmata archaeon]
MKVVIPAAGLGSRFLPATKTQPKEMLPIVDRPIIHYVVAEAVASGADDILIVTGRGKRALEDYFDVSPELAAWKHHPALIELEELARKARIHFVRQREPRGLADAISCARHHTGGEAFGVLLGDTINLCEPPLLRQLWRWYEELGSSVIAVEPVPRASVANYGIVQGRRMRPGLLRCERLIEKPDPARAPSRLAITGAYVVTPEIYGMIDRTRPGINGEVQLTDALNRLAQTTEVYAARFQGERFDIGNPMLWLRANLDLAWRRPELRARLRPVVRAISQNRAPSKRTSRART